jgi:hypothetical protein
VNRFFAKVGVRAVLGICDGAHIGRAARLSVGCRMFRRVDDFE